MSWEESLGLHIQPVNRLESCGLTQDHLLCGNFISRFWSLITAAKSLSVSIECDYRNDIFIHYFFSQHYDKYVIRATYRKKGVVWLVVFRPLWWERHGRAHSRGACVRDLPHLGRPGVRKMWQDENRDNMKIETTTFSEWPTSPGQVLPPKTCIHSQNSTASWGPDVQTHKPVRDISSLNHNITSYSQVLSALKYIIYVCQGAEIVGA